MLNQFLTCDMLSNYLKKTNANTKKACSFVVQLIFQVRGTNNYI